MVVTQRIAGCFGKVTGGCLDLRDGFPATGQTHENLLDDIFGLIDPGAADKPSQERGPFGAIDHVETTGRQPVKRIRQQSAHASLRIMVA
ncbi:hypothetical protein OLX02_18715 [Novosphingobium sp. KCTC 2891]|nr:hypothetical protein [Novosphingobium sp. KCTC 2891]